MNKFWINILLAVAGIGLLIAGVSVFGGKGKTAIRTLPYYRPVNTSSVNNDSAGRHTIREFSFTDQTGKTVTRANFKGHITVVDFFFTTCTGICPVMTNQMARVYARYESNPNVLFLSHTVNPENDSVPVLAAYSKRHNANPEKWKFVTGNKPELYDMARRSYLISDSDGDGSKEDFVHSDQFCLLDGEGHVRGRYDGTNAAEVDRLMIDLDLLLAEMQQN